MGIGRRRVKEVGREEKEKKVGYWELVMRRRVTARISREREKMKGYLLPWRYEGIAIVEQKREKNRERGGVRERASE